MEQYEAAVHAYKRARQFRCAAETYASAALMYRNQGRNKESGHAYEKASKICRRLATAYAKFNLAEQTKEAFTRAATFCTLAAISYERSRLVENMTNAWSMAAKSYDHARKLEEAAAAKAYLQNVRDANESAADGCMLMNQYQRAAKLYSRADLPDAAAHAKALAKSSRELAGT